MYSEYQLSSKNRGYPPCGLAVIVELNMTMEVTMAARMGSMMEFGGGPSLQEFQYQCHLSSKRYWSKKDQYQCVQ